MKIAVILVTVILAASLVALARGRYRLHGQLNVAFFSLTVAALVAFEVVIRFVDPRLFEYIQENDELRRTLRVHLCFAVPSALLLPVMLFTGLRRKRQLHVAVGCLFLALWVATFITGVFRLPHDG